MDDEVNEVKTYKKSKSANATEAPTSGKTQENLEARINNPSLTIEQMDFVNLMEQFYTVHGHLMTLGEATNDYGFEHDEYVDLISAELVRLAINERGIEVKPSAYKHLLSGLDTVDTDDTIVNSDAVGPNVSKQPDIKPDAWRDKALSPIQLIAANTMLDLVDTRSEKKKLQDLGLSTTQWQMWLKNPTFSQYLHERAEAMLGEHQHDAALALIDKIRAGDLKAIEYYNEMTGRYVKQTVNTAGSNQLTDFKQMLIRILEVISEEVDDPQIGARIADRLRGLISMQHMATMMTEPDEIVVPQIAKTREMTPRLMELMEKGAGS